jgi:hypothetical protein
MLIMVLFPLARDFGGVVCPDCLAAFRPGTSGAEDAPLRESQNHSRDRNLSGMPSVRKSHHKESHFDPESG